MAWDITATVSLLMVDWLWTWPGGLINGSSASLATFGKYFIHKQKLFINLPSTRTLSQSKGTRDCFKLKMFIRDHPSVTAVRQALTPHKSTPS